MEETQISDIPPVPQLEPESTLPLEESQAEALTEPEATSTLEKESSPITPKKKKRTLSAKQRENLRKGRERLKEVMEQRKKLKIEEKVSAYLDTFLKAHSMPTTTTTTKTPPSPTAKARASLPVEDITEEEYSSSEEEIDTEEKTPEFRTYIPPYTTTIQKEHAAVVIPERAYHLGFL